MKRFFACLTAALFMLSAPAAFAAACYTAAEVEAEQGLRIHSELMVIGLTCAKMPGGQAMYQQYKTFTQKNQDLLSQYERDIIRYYSQQGVANPERALHTLRTNLANTISGHAIKMSTPSFCQNFGPRITKALQMDRTSLRKWAQHVFPATPTSRPACAGQVAQRN